MLKLIITYVAVFLVSPLWCETCKDGCHTLVPGKLNVHLVPHSHDDVGWLKTYDQYYYGNNVQEHKGVRGVQNILDTVVQSLLDNPDRRFIQVETAYFARWWEQQTQEVKDTVKGFVNNGTLELVSGGWTMNDEATTNYQSIIDQFTLGLRALRDMLGDCAIPRVGWQIDPFGHSNTMATIFAQLGFEGLFFTRLDYRDAKKRLETNTSEFIWKGNPDLDSASEIFTSLIYRFYDTPPNFCWDVQCNDTPVIDDEESFDYNVPEMVKKFTDYINKQAESYATKNILITMGGDFTYQAAHMYYANIDKLIEGFKKFEKNINVIYSTPSCYIKAVKEEAAQNKLNFSVKTDDFMPHASDEHSYWTGYYTSRPTLKGLERLGNNLLQVTKQLMVYGDVLGLDFNNDVTDLKSTMGIMQHHDAITGTEKQHVSNDYTYMLVKAMEAAQANVDKIVFDLLSVVRTDEDMPGGLNSCLMSNMTRCVESNLKNFTVAVYNPSSHLATHYVRLPVVSTNYTVQTLNGGVVKHQISPNIDTFDDVTGSGSVYELTFLSEDLPPHGVKYYYITKNDDIENKLDLITPKDDLILGDQVNGVELDENGFVKKLTLNGESLEIRQEFMYYKSATGDNVVPKRRASGAYVFRPFEGTKAIPVSTNATHKVYKGELFDEVHQVFNPWLKQIIRLYKSEGYIQFDWIVGPITEEDSGIEVITRYKTNLKSNGVFYTDSNGRELVKRTRDHRETFVYTNEEPISGNYYPVTSRIALRDEEKKRDFVILNDRSQGGSSLEDGALELMLHRKLLCDDNFGVDEVLNETEFGRAIRVRGQHYMLYVDKSKSSAHQIKTMEKITFAPWVFLGNASSDELTLTDYMTQMYSEFAGIEQPLPDNLRILTMEHLSHNKVLLRLEHPFSKDDDEPLSKPATVKFENLFTLFNVISFNETTLGANQLIEENQRLSLGRKAPNETITLNPMEIKTFILEIEPRYITAGAQSVTFIPALVALLFMLSFLY